MSSQSVPGQWLDKYTAKIMATREEQPLTLVGEVLLVVEYIPLGVDGTAPGDNASLAVDGHGHVAEKDASVDCKI